MDNKEAKEILEKWKYRGSDGLTDERPGYIEGWYNKKDDVAFEMAIKSLDMWDKVLEEIDNGHCKVTNDYDHGRNYGLYMASQIIEKYKKEVEE